jgi:hypothetical protein
MQNIIIPLLVLLIAVVYLMPSNQENFYLYRPGCYQGLDGGMKCGNYYYIPPLVPDYGYPRYLHSDIIPNLEIQKRKYINVDLARYPWNYYSLYRNSKNMPEKYYKSADTQTGISKPVEMDLDPMTIPNSNYVTKYVWNNGYYFPY